MRREQLSRGRERFQFTVDGDSGTQGAGTAGPCEDQVKLVPGPVGRRRRGE